MPLKFCLDDFSVSTCRNVMIFCLFLDVIDLYRYEILHEGLKFLNGGLKGFSCVMLKPHIFLKSILSKKKLGEYDQENPQSHTADH